MRYNIELDHAFVTDWVTRKSKPDIEISREAKEIRIVDLFCGCGGLTSGIFEAVFSMGHKPKVALALDSNEEFISTYKNNFINFSEHILIDRIENLFQSDLDADLNEVEKSTKEMAGQVEILVGGPPCQGHSDLNNYSRRDDPRNNLYFNCARAISVLEPNIALIENVPSVVHDKGRVVQKTIDYLHRNNYYTKEFTIDFLDLGLPQTRKRHVLIASKFSDFINELDYKSKRPNDPVLYDFIGDLEGLSSSDNVMVSKGKVSKRNRERIEFLFNNSLYDLPDSERPPCHKDKKHSYKSSYGRLRYDHPAQTITSGFGSMGQGRYVHPTQRRTITALEASRIQGFPCDFDFRTTKSITSVRRMIANAVPPQLSYSISTCYFDYLNEKYSCQHLVLESTTDI